MSCTPNPKATAWFRAVQGLLDMGVDTFKTDFGERIPVNVRYYDGSDPERMHNYYRYLYNKAVFELLEEVKGKNGAAVFARSATVGGQKFPVVRGSPLVNEFTTHQGVFLKALRPQLW